MTKLASTHYHGFIDREAMVAAAEREVREEAKRHPDDPWTPDRSKRWAERIEAPYAVDVATPEYAAAVADARKRLRGECLAARIEKVMKAANVRDRYNAEGNPVPLWARNVLDWAAEPEKITKLYFPENDEAESPDDAIAAIEAALR